MRVLHVVPTYWPAFRYGGPIFSVHALTRCLAARRHDVEVFTTNVDGGGVLPVDTERPVDVDGVRVRYFESRSPRRVYRAPEMAKELERRVSEFDLVHLHSVFLWPTLAAARAAERHAVPFVLSPRGMLARDLIRERGRARKTAWIELFERRTIERAAFVHVTSAHEEEEFRRLSLDARRVMVVPNGVEVDECADEEVSAELRKIAAAGPFALALGRISWKKSLPDLLDVTAAVPDLSLVLAGPDDEGLAAKLLARARDLGIGERVHYAGAVLGADKRFLLERAELVAFPSRGENFGNVVLEAMAHATPVVCTSNVGAASLVTRAGAGLVCEPGVEALRRAVRAFLDTSSAERSAMGDRGRRLAREEFPWGRIAGLMADAYAGVLRPRHQRRAS